MKATTTTVALLCAFALCVQLHDVDAAPKQREENTCRSVGALKFDASQNPMQRSKGLDVCSKYKKNTCCNETHVHALRLKIREPAVAKFNAKCQRITEEMVCSSCHPFVGTWQIKTVCPRMCDDWFAACKDEFYAYSGAGTLAPCYGNALICSPLSHIATSGAAMCEAMGFHVGTDTDAEGSECFDGSVPHQLGAAEPVEPWQQLLQRLFEEQSSDPSGAFMLVLFVPVAALFAAFRLLRRKFDGRSSNGEHERHLQLLEVRRLQQQRYGRTSYADYDSDSDSVNNDENEDENERKNERKQLDATDGSAWDDSVDTTATDGSVDVDSKVTDTSDPVAVTNAKERVETASQ